MKKSSKDSFFLSYMKPNINVNPKEEKEKFTNMYIEEIKRRTKIFQELNYDRRHIKKRIKQNIRWEFELLGLPEFYNLIDKIIDQTYTPKR